MEPEGSLPHSQVPANSPYPEPARSSPYPHIPTSWRSILTLSSHLRLGLPSGLFPSSFPTKTQYTWMGMYWSQNKTWTLIQMVLSSNPGEMCVQIFLLTDWNLHLCQRWNSGKVKNMGPWSHSSKSMLCCWSPLLSLSWQPCHSR